jgi:hypothetical protein
MTSARFTAVLGCCLVLAVAAAGAEDRKGKEKEKEKAPKPQYPALPSETPAEFKPTFHV